MDALVIVNIVVLLAGAVVGVVAVVTPEPARRTVRNTFYALTLTEILPWLGLA